MTTINQNEIRFTQPDYLRKARELAGLTQQELADRIGVDRASVVAYEKRGTKKPIILREWARITEVREELLQPQPSDYKSHVRPTFTRTRPARGPLNIAPRNRS